MCSFSALKVNRAILAPYENQERNRSVRCKYCTVAGVGDKFWDIILESLLELRDESRW